MASFANDDFAYTEKNLIDQVNSALRSHFKDLALHKSPTEDVHVTIVTAYGEAFATSAKGTRFKGSQHNAFLYTLNLEFHWYAKKLFGNSTVGSTGGKVIVSDVNYDNQDPETWQVKVKLDSEGTAALNQGPPPEPSPVQAQLKDIVVGEGVDVIKKALHAFVTNLTMDSLLEAQIHDKENSTASNPPDDEVVRVEIVAEGSDDEEEAKAREAAPSTSDAYIKELRKQLLGPAYKALVFDGVVENPKVWKLTICSIKDDDVTPLTEALKQHGELIERLDLEWNDIGDKGVERLCNDAFASLPSLRKLSLKKNRVSNVGLQSITTALALGQLPNIEQVDLRDNPGIDKIGEVVLTGLKLMRKGVDVLV